jgi:hypothetical protein
MSGVANKDPLCSQPSPYMSWPQIPGDARRRQSSEANMKLTNTEESQGRRVRFKHYLVESKISRLVEQQRLDDIVNWKEHYAIKLITAATDKNVYKYGKQFCCAQKVLLSIKEDLCG